MKTFIYSRYKNLIIIFFSFAGFILQAQTINYRWAKGMGSNGWDYARDIFVDKKGAAYITGSYEGTVDFDPGIGTTNLSSLGGRDIFVAKYDSAGALLFAFSLGGSSDEQGEEIAVDTAGNIHLSGWFEGTCDFDPSITALGLTSTSGSQDIFFAKYTSAGNYIYAKGMVGGSSADTPYGMMIDSSQNVYLSGYFQGTVDFDPGLGTQNLTSAGGWDIYIAKYDINGNYIFAEAMGNAGSNDNAYALYLDGARNIYIAGVFQGTIDFDPGAGTQNLISAGSFDIFLAKYSSSGSFVYAKNIGGAGADYCFGMYVDIPGNAYITGRFVGTADFDPGAGTYNLVSNGSADAYFAKYNTSGNLVLAEHIGGSGDDQGAKIVCDGSGNIILGGTFQNTIDFDPGIGTQNASSSGATDVYLSMYNSAGGYLCSARMGGNADENVLGMREKYGAIYITGFYNASGDFDPGAGIQNLPFAGGTSDIYIGRYKIPGCSPVVVSIGNDQDFCQGITSSLSTGTTYSSYLWSTGSSASSINVSSSGTYWVSVTDGSGCTGRDSVDIVVYPTPTVSWNNPQKRFCINGGLSTLSGASPSGGAFSGIGISGGSFNPSAASTGNHTMTYTYSDANGCTDSIHNTFTVLSIPVVSWNDFDTARCLNEPPFPLSGGESPAGGTFSGPGVSAGTFNVATAGIGTHSITYSYTDTSGCIGAVTKIITVSNCVSSIRDNYSLNKKVNIFPNPARNEFSVMLTDFSHSDIKDVFLLSSDGKILKPAIVKSIDNKIDISVIDLSPGLYQLLINTSETIYTNRVVIVQ